MYQGIPLARGGYFVKQRVGMSEIWGVFFSMFPLNHIERKQMQKKVKESEEHKGKKIKWQ